MAQFVSHTSGTTDIGGGSNTLSRGKSVVDNPIGDASGSPQAGKVRLEGGKYAQATGGLGEGTAPRETPKNQHGITGEPERAAKFHAAGHDA